MQGGDKHELGSLLTFRHGIRTATVKPPTPPLLPTVSVVVPVLNERAALPALLRGLQAVDGIHELLFVDGGSSDDTVEWLQTQGHRVLKSARGRGQQLAVGAQASTGSVLWLLHADTSVPPTAVCAIQKAVAVGNALGAFRLRFEGESLSARGMTWFYARLRHAGILYGDAGIFVRRDVYEAVGGIPAWPLFEDQGLLRRLRRAGYARPLCLDVTLGTSSRRFAGWRFPLVFTQWVALQMMFWLGVPPRWMARCYGVRRAAGETISGR